MLKRGVVERCISPWNSPIQLVRAPGKPDRPVANFSQTINPLLMEILVELLGIQDIIDACSGARFLTLMDLLSAFWQLLLHRLDRHKTAFSTTTGQYQYIVLPMGISIAPAVFSAYVTEILQDLGVYAYADDLTMPHHADDTVTDEQVLQEALPKVQKVLERLREHGVTVAGKSASGLSKRRWC